MPKLGAYIRLLRPKEYVKNLFVFFPLFFGGGMTRPELLLAGGLAFAAFCLAASAIYILNDSLDREMDRNHPVKCRRPIASGEVPLAAAAVIGAALACGAVALAWANGFLPPLGAYLALNVVYSLYAKHVSILDVSCVAAGFVLRVLAGTQATHYVTSSWLVLMVFLLTLFLALSKRWDDLSLQDREPERGMVRRCAAQYSKQFILSAITLLSTANTVCYIMYTLSPEVRAHLGSEHVFLSAFWVIIGNLRYLQIVLVSDDSGSPTKVMLRDTFIQCAVCCWVLHMAILIYLK
ncbi:MAG: hypothetical protein AUJ49_07785 [Desulfovibrionaceae bacterium CG1_02_65_16]|nr:MAG: hypothetical protein AUJ49_07785 [Desulfovibrionaceae bacterium CG1_02_65_16]